VSLATVALVAGLAPVQAVATPTSTLPVAVPAPQPLVWEPCDDQPDRDCSELTVPRDYNDPNGPQEKLPVARARATDPSNRVGPLLFNLGGPGQPSTGTVKFGDLAYTFSQEIVEKFDIVGFDPRGTSGNGITCLLAGPRETYWETDRIARTSSQLNQVLGQERQANQGCVTHSPPLVRHVDTASVVRDMEMLRQAMNLPQINFVGFSYGTFIGERYAQLYPGKVRAMVLDAPVDRGVSDLQSFAESNLAFDAGWRDFVAWCQANTACRLRGQDIDAVVNQVMATARISPIPAPNSPDSQRPVNDWILTEMLLAATAPGPITYGYAEAMIVDAVAGDASLAREIYDGATGTPGDYFEGGDQHRAITCEDTRWSQLLPNSAAVTALAVASKTIAPRFGEVNVFGGPVQCVGFPVPAVEPPPLSLKSGSGQPTLVIGGAKDTSTPLLWAERAQKRILGSKLLVRNGTGYGHGSLNKSRCVKAAASMLLVHLSLAVPATCPTDPDLYPETASILGPATRTGKGPAVPEVLLATR
jgi:pimeloyl-ACP methyl ester carboxylesterase